MDWQCSIKISVLNFAMLTSNGMVQGAKDTEDRSNYADECLHAFDSSYDKME
jgi:hypothetical protein